MKKILITGSAGFIGVNSAVKFVNSGWQVIALDNLSRPGAQDNLDWLQQDAEVDFIKADIRDHNTINEIVSTHKPDVLLHLAALRLPPRWLIQGKTLKSMHGAHLTSWKRFDNINPTVFSLMRNQ